MHMPVWLPSLLTAVAMLLPPYIAWEFYARRRPQSWLGRRYRAPRYWDGRPDGWGKWPFRYQIVYLAGLLVRVALISLAVVSLRLGLDALLRR